MQLAPGSKLGPYEIVAPLGAGGMGEVYRARDPRLQREVAIKILPATLATDAVAHARFEREVQAVAALSHPNILAIHDVGRDGDRAFAVMELLQGRTLREALADGPLPLRKAIDYALQIAHGLAAAHARGIVHRDLKPENVFVCSDGRVKILDFGLAHATSQTPAATAETIADTTPGTVVGTVGYMAPEQIRGHDIDARADIFAFGAVLHEMLSGTRTFAGDTRADIMTAVMRNDPPDLTASRPDVPPALDQLVRRCLDKSRDERFGSARDLAYALEAVSTGTSARVTGGDLAPPRPATRRARWLAVAAALAAGIAVGAAATAKWSTPSPKADAVAVRFVIASLLGNWVAVSPDGEWLAWSERHPQETGAFVKVRRLSDREPQIVGERRSLALAGAWHPDGRRVVLLDTALSIVDVATRAERVIYTPTAEQRKSNVYGIAVRDNDVIIGSALGLWRVNLSGTAQLTVMTPIDASKYTAYAYPSALPDGRVIFTAWRADKNGFDTLVAGGGGEVGARIDVPPRAFRVFVDRDVILYAQNNQLFAQRIDWTSLQLQENPVTVASDVLVGNFDASAAVSPAGVLAYRQPAPTVSQFEWVDRGGRPLGLAGPADTFTNFDLSPDDSKIAVTRRDQARNALWIIDLTRSLATPSDQPDAAPPSDPTWSPDGKEIAFRRGSTLVARPSFGGADRIIAKWAGYPDSWTRDGKYLAAGRPVPEGYELWVVRADGSGEASAIVQGATQADELRFSPDGKWLAFHAILPGTGTVPQVHVVPFPPTGERWQLSTHGGVQPRWGNAGTELFYLDPAGQLMRVALPGGDPRRARAPEGLFHIRFEPSALMDQIQPSHDGKRFLIRRPTSGSAQDLGPVHVLVNWRKMAGLD